MRHLMDHPMRRCVALERDALGCAVLCLQRLAKERLGCGDIAPGTEPEVDCLALLVDRAIKIDPFAADLHVRLIDSPRAPSRAGEVVPAFFKLRRIALYPAHHRRMRKHDPPLRHHLDEVAKAQFVTQVPTVGTQSWCSMPI